MNILLSHYVDLDGIAPIILSKYFGLDIDLFLPIKYNEEKIKDSFIVHEYANKNNSIIIVDFSISNEFYSYIKQNFKSYLIFDHHENSKIYENDENCFIDMKKSGTKLFYNWIKKNIKKRTRVVVDHFVKLVDTYDMWNQESDLWEDARNLNNVLWQSMDFIVREDSWEKFNPFITYQLKKIKEIDTWMWTDHENMLIQKSIKKEIDEYHKALDNMKIRVDNKDIMFIIYHGSSKISFVCSELLKEFKKVEYVININTWQKGKKCVNGKLSVRSKGDFDVTKLYGISGHKNAGGGNFTEKFIVNLWIGKIKQLSYIKERK